MEYSRPARHYYAENQQSKEARITQLDEFTYKTTFHAFQLQKSHPKAQVATFPSQASTFTHTYSWNSNICREVIIYLFEQHVRVF